jgi:hypothetical protein
MDRQIGKEKPLPGTIVPVVPGLSRPLHIRNQKSQRIGQRLMPLFTGFSFEVEEESYFCVRIGDTRLAEC